MRAQYRVHIDQLDQSEDFDAVTQHSEKPKTRTDSALKRRTYRKQLYHQEVLHHPKLNQNSLKYAKARKRAQSSGNIGLDLYR